MAEGSTHHLTIRETNTQLPGLEHIFFSHLRVGKKVYSNHVPHANLVLTVAINGHTFHHQHLKCNPGDTKQDKHRCEETSATKPALQL